MSPKNSSASQFCRRNPDLRDFVKDSMYREVQGLSSKGNRTVDSPRLQSKVSDDHRSSSYQDTRQKIHVDLRDSVRESPWYCDEPQGLLRSSSYHGKDANLCSISRDAPRFSCDGREVNRDFLRFGFDVRDGSMRSLNVDSRSKVSKPVESRTPPGHQARPPSVVAKLMGLETLPDSVRSDDSNPRLGHGYPEKDLVKLPKSFANADQSKSSKNLRKELSSPRWRNPDSSTKRMPRVPIEPAPWKQIDVSSSRKTRAQTKASTAIPSVYREIEERLQDLEFTRSGRDLRALKRILEAMQSKGFLETDKDNDCQQKPRSSKLLQVDQVLGSVKRRTSSSQRNESPIVIMKPVNLVGKSGTRPASVISLNILSSLAQLEDDEAVDTDIWKGLGCGGAVRDFSSKSGERNSTINHANVKPNRTLNDRQGSTRTQHLIKDGNGAFRRNNSESISPRMQQKNIELERRSRPPTPPNTMKPRRQSNKPQQGDCNSPGSRRRLNYPGVPQSHEFNVVSNNLSCHELGNSVQSNETIIWSSKNAVNHGIERSLGIRGCQKQSTKKFEAMTPRAVEKKCTVIPSRDESKEINLVSPEYSSPISVLDNVVCGHNSTPIEDVEKTLEVDISVVQGNSGDSLVCNSSESDSTLWNLGRFDPMDPDHKYISEVLSASGLHLKELCTSPTSFDSCSSSHPINPELFSALEQTKARSPSLGIPETCSQSKREELHRKLIYDAVNEILATKLVSPGPFPEPRQHSQKSISKILQELWSEIEEIRAKPHKCSPEEEEARWKNILCKDMMHESKRWIGFDDRMSGAVLDVERLIFKDLVNEIVIGESGGLKAKPGRRSRLVAK